MLYRGSSLGEIFIMRGFRFSRSSKPQWRLGHFFVTDTKKANFSEVRFMKQPNHVDRALPNKIIASLLK